MKFKLNWGFVWMFAVFAFIPNAGIARNFQFQLYKGESSAGDDSWYSGSVKRDTFKITMSPASTKDTDEDMEIRAATLLKIAKGKTTVINDIAKFNFTPARGRSIFYVAAGVANGACYHANIKGGVIIEIWQNGKVIKHWSSGTGPISKTKLTDSVKCSFIGTKGYDSSFCSSFDNATQIIADENNPKPEPAAGGAAKGAGNKGKFELSDFSMAMFRADDSLRTMTRMATLRLSDDYYGPFSDAAQTYWSVSVDLECTEGCCSVNGYAQKTSQVGGRLKELLKDGAPHHVIVKIVKGSGYNPSRYVTIEDFCDDGQAGAAGAAGDDDLTELVASDYSFAMFKADPSLQSITFVTKARLGDSYYGAFSNCQRTHWSIELMHSAGDHCWTYVHGFVPKDSSVGKRMLDLVKDGAQHPVLIKVARSQPGSMGSRYVLIKDFKILSKDDPAVLKLGM